MKGCRILNVSPTPLVDSPRKISEAINLYTEYKSDIIIFNDYPGALAGIFSGNTLIFNQSKDICMDVIRRADIIHIHNFLTKEQESLLFKNSKSSVKFIYQVHSPLREGPVFVKYADESTIEYEEKLVVAQYQPRLYMDYTIVPNITLESPSLKLLIDGETPIVLFSPAHTRTGGRWNDKYSKELKDSLFSLDNLGMIQNKIVTGVKPYELFKIRERSHITIDEIVTGSFHQISLEGLCKGNVVINNSDYFSDKAMNIVTDSDEYIPFYKASNDNFAERMIELVEDPDKIRDIQQQSYNFYKNNLMPSDLIKKYEMVYNRALGL